MAYNKDQWTSSFEDQLTILRRHLTQRVLTTMSLAAWHEHGKRDEDPIEAARKVARSLEARSRRPAPVILVQPGTRDQ